MALPKYADGVEFGTMNYAAFMPSVVIAASILLQEMHEVNAEWCAESCVVITFCCSSCLKAPPPPGPIFPVQLRDNELTLYDPFCLK